MHSFDLDQLLSATPGHFYWLDCDNQYLGCNDYQARALGLASRTEIVGKRNSELYSLYPEIASIYDKNNLDVMQSGVQAMLEEPALLEDGSHVIVLSHKVPQRNQEGQVIGLFGISLDLRHQKHIETTLKKEKQQMEYNLEKILDAAPGDFYWKDKEGVYLGCNQLVANLFCSKSKTDIIGKKADVVGKKDSDLWPLYAKKLVENDQKVMKAGQTMTFEEKINGKTYLSVKTPMRDENGEIIGIIGNSLNIHHLKEIEMYLKETQEIAEAARALTNNKFSFFQPWKTQHIAQFVHDNLE